MEIYLLMAGIFGAMIAIIAMSILHRKPLTQIQYEAELDLKDEKINALYYDNQRLEQISKSRLESVIDLRGKLKFKDSVIKNLLADIKFAEDTGKLKLSEELNGIKEK